MRSLLLTCYCLIALTSLGHASFYNNAGLAADGHENERDVKLKITLKVEVHGHLAKMRIKMIIPHNIKDRQTVNDLSFSIEPDSVYSVNSNTYALFRFYDLDKDFKIVMKGDITIYRRINMSADTSEKNMDKYLIAEPNIEIENDRIITVAASLKQKTDIETVMKTFEYVKDHITYKKKDAIGAEKVLESGVGKCMDYSDLFVALLRANHIPAKSIFGIVVGSLSDNPLHAWPEAYLKKQGWIRFDPTTGHSDITADGSNFVMKISNKYITFSEGRNDPELHVSLYHSSWLCKEGSYAKIRPVLDAEGAD